MRTKTLLITTLCLMGSTVMLLGVSFAQSGTGDQLQGGQPPVIATLMPCCDTPDLDAIGKVARGTLPYTLDVWGDWFEGTVKLPLPSPDLGIMDIVAAAEADLSLILSRGGAPYAECFLEFDGKERPDESSGAMAVFKVSLRSQMWRGYPIVQAQMGACDLALKIRGMQPGLPKVQAGDAATAVVITSDATIRFLDGRFQSTKSPR